MPEEEERKVTGNPEFGIEIFLSGHKCSASSELVFQDSKHNDLNNGV